MVYSSESIGTSVIQSLLDTNGDDNEGNIPKPLLLEATSVEPRLNLSVEGDDVIIIRSEDAGIQENWRDHYAYADWTVFIRVEIYTIASRQRLYDLMQEVRRIIRAQKHNVGAYQLARYVSFSELTQEQLNFWAGFCRISLESKGIYIG